MLLVVMGSAFLGIALVTTLLPIAKRVYVRRRFPRTIAAVRTREAAMAAELKRFWAASERTARFSHHMLALVGIVHDRNLAVWLWWARHDVIRERHGTIPALPWSPEGTSADDIPEAS